MMDARIGRPATVGSPAPAPPRRICATCPRWQVPPGRLARRCCIDGAITIADHHCHLRGHLRGDLRTGADEAAPGAPPACERAGRLRSEPDCRG